MSTLDDFEKENMDFHMKNGRMLEKESIKGRFGSFEEGSL